MAKSPEIPLVLIINHEEWTARSLESILKPAGFAVLKAYTARHGLDLASRVPPDLVVIDHRLPDLTGRELCERLRALPTIRASTPVLVFTTGPIGRRERLEILQVGAWDVLHSPFDPEELLVRIRTFLEAKRDADAALDESHVDPVTGFYNLHGLMKRVTETAADATRSGRELACVMMGPEPLNGDGTDEEAEVDVHPLASETPPAVSPAPDVTKELARVLVAKTRLSDTLARVGETDFVIVAPGTSAEGARRLAERLLEAVEQHAARGAGGSLLRIKAGFYAVSDPTAEEARVIPENLLSRAASALRKAQAEGNGEKIRPFEAE